MLSPTRNDPASAYLSGTTGSREARPRCRANASRRVATAPLQTTWKLVRRPQLGNSLFPRDPAWRAADTELTTRPAQSLTPAKITRGWTISLAPMLELFEMTGAFTSDAPRIRRFERISAAPLARQTDAARERHTRDWVSLFPLKLPRAMSLAEG